MYQQRSNNGKTKLTNRRGSTATSTSKPFLFHCKTYHQRPVFYLCKFFTPRCTIPNAVWNRLAIHLTAVTKSNKLSSTPCSHALSSDHIVASSPPPLALALSVSIMIVSSVQPWCYVYLFSILKENISSWVDATIPAAVRVPCHAIVNCHPQSNPQNPT